MVLYIFALFVIVILISAAIWLVVFLGNWPGKIARKRDHPQAEAITALSWIGLITGVGWFVAFVWAYYKPGKRHHTDVHLEARVKALENKLEQRQTGGSEL
jgi:uncharacterized RDD family membrane protein YckC